MVRVGTAQRLEREIAANTQRFTAALTRGDGDGAVAAYVEDALLLPPIGDPISGREAIARFWRSGIEIGLRVVEFEMRGLTVTGGALVEHGRYRMVLASAERVSKVRAGTYCVVHVEFDGGSWGWACQAFRGASENRT